MNESADKPDGLFGEARDLLDQTSPDFAVEQQLDWGMSLQNVAASLIESMDIHAWGKNKANLDVGAKLAKALAKVHLAESYARLVAVAVAVNAAPNGEQEKEMVALFEELSAPSSFVDKNRQMTIAQDCVSALSNVYAFYNDKVRDPSRAKVPMSGERGYNLRKAVIARLFNGALLDDPDNMIEACAVIASCSPPDSVERLAAITGLLRYPQYADFLGASDAEGYIENLAPIGSAIRHQAEALLRSDATFPLKDLFVRAREKKAV